MDTFSFQNFNLFLLFFFRFYYYYFFSGLKCLRQSFCDFRKQKVNKKIEKKRERKKNKTRSRKENINKTCSFLFEFVVCVCIYIEKSVVDYERHILCSSWHSFAFLFIYFTSIWFIFSFFLFSETCKLQVEYLLFIYSIIPMFFSHPIFLCLHFVFHFFFFFNKNMTLKKSKAKKK